MPFSLKGCLADPSLHCTDTDSSRNMSINITVPIPIEIVHQIQAARSNRTELAQNIYVAEAVVKAIGALPRPPHEKFNISIVSFGRPQISLRVSAAMTVQELRYMISDRDGTPPELQHVSCEGQTLGRRLGSEKDGWETMPLAVVSSCSLSAEQRRLLIFEW